MNRKYAWIFLIVLVSIMVIFIYYGFVADREASNQDTQNIYSDLDLLPQTVNISLYYDHSSSGGSRNLNSTLNYVDGKLVSGWSKYDAYPGTGGEQHSECIVDMNNLTWIDKNTSEACEFYSSDIPPDLESLKNGIKNGNGKPADKCMHFDNCYEIIK
jgi:hypothetical protein